MLGGADGPVTEVRAQDAERLARALERRGHGVERRRRALLVRGATPEQVGAVAPEDRVALAELAPRSRSLEDAFFELTEGESDAPCCAPS